MLGLQYMFVCPQPVGSVIDVITRIEFKGASKSRMSPGDSKRKNVGFRECTPPAKTVADCTFLYITAWVNANIANPGNCKYCNNM